jgi:hypothetical protein
MAYQLISSITSHENLLDQLATFLANMGWTVNRNTTDGTQREIAVETAFDSGIGSEEFHFGLETAGTGDTAWIQVGGATGYSSGDGRTAQPGYSGQGRISVKQGSMPRAWLHGTAQYCHLVVEVSAGYVQMLGFGCLDRAYAPTLGRQAGAFVYANRDQTGSAYYWNALTSKWTSANFGLFTGRQNGTEDGTNPYTQIQSADGIRVRYEYGGGASADWSTDNAGSYFAQTNIGAIDGLTYYPWNTGFEFLYLPCGDNSRPILAVEVFAPVRPVALASHFLAGRIPGMRFMDARGLSNAHEFDIGDDTWQAFGAPFQNPAVMAIDNARRPGFCFLKVT